MIRVTGLGYGLLWLMGWVAGCRSEQTAFRFQPIITQAAVPVSDTAAPAEAVAASAYCPAGSTLATGKFSALKHEPRRKLLSGSSKATARHRQLWPRLALRNPTPPNAGQLARPAADNSHWDSVLLVLGGAVCAAALVVGIRLGGGMGLLAGISLYLVGARLIARGFGGPGKSAASGFAPIRARRSSAAMPDKERPGQSRRPAAETSFGETVFTVGTLMVLVALILGLTGVLSGTTALLLGLISFLLAIAAYNGFKW